MKGLVLFLGLSLTAWAAAQEMTAEQVVSELETAIADLQDARFDASGSYTGEDGEAQTFNAEVSVAFGEDVARIAFSEPEELAGNVVVIDGNTLRNYVAAEDAVIEMQLGGMNQGETAMSEATTAAQPDLSLFGVSLDEAAPLTLDLSNLFQGWTPDILEAAEDRYELRFRNPDAELDHIDAVVVQGEDGWTLEELRFVRDGSSLLEVTLSELETNTGLTASELTELP